MRFRSASVRWLGLLALACLNVAGAQPSPPAAEATLPADALAQTLPAELAQPFEQAWDVVELAGQPLLSDTSRPPRVVLRPNGQIWVDGGCNYFSGRIERDTQGLFRVSKYGSNHRICDKPPRSEAFLNSALMMVDNFRWDRGLLLRSGGSELLRLRPSANQDVQALEQGLAARHAVPAAAALAPAAASALSPTQARQLASQDCRPVKAAKKAGKNAGKAAAKSRQAKPPVCQPVQLKAGKATRPVRASAKASQARRGQAAAAAKSSAKKNRPAAQKRSKS